MSCGRVFKQEMEKRESEQDGGWEEKKKIILRGFGFPNPLLKSVLLSYTWSPPPTRAVSPLLYQILSGDFQWEMVEMKDFNSSLVSVIQCVKWGEKNINFLLSW